MTKINYIIIATFAGVLQGCGIYTNYKQPQIDTDHLLRNETAAVSDTARSLLSWREMFTDPLLQQLIETGLTNNSDLQVAKLKIDEERATLNAAKLAFLPSAELSASGNLSSYDGSKTQKTYSLGADASWEIDIFGKLSNAEKMSAASQEASQAYAQAVQTQLIATIADDYYLLLMYDEQIKVTQETIDSWKEYIETQKALMEAGQADRASVSQAEASKLSAEVTWTKLKQQITELENSLCALVGSGSAAIERSTLDEQQLSEKHTEQIDVQMLVNRPDVRQAEAQLKQAFYATNKSRATFYPSLTLSGSAGWTNSGGTGITNPGALLLQAAGSLTQPLFNKGLNIANLKIAKAQQEEALVHWKQSILDSGKEVNNYLSAIDNTKKKIELETKQIGMLQVTLKDTQAMMEYGSTNYLQVIVARQSLLSAQLDLLSDRYSQLENRVMLYQALGGGI